MASNKLIFFLLPSLALLQAVSAVEYTITGNAAGTPGGNRFNNEIGADYSRQTMQAATNFIWRIFRQSAAADRKNVQKVTLFIDKDYNGVAFANSNNEIHISANYIAGYGGDLKREITGIVYHEMAHVWQWNDPSAPGWVIEGIADYVRLKAGYIPGHWVRPGGGNSWEESYDKTARFFEYLEGRRSGFVADLNRRLRNGYSPNYFVQLMGKPVDQLWAEYKAAFGN